MLPTLTLKRHDLQPYLRFSVPDADSLSGATITCTMVNNDTGLIKIDRQAAGCVITDAIAREAEYRWQAGDTDTSGMYYVEFEIVPVSGGKFTVPVDDRQYVIIADDADGV